MAPPKRQIKVVLKSSSSSNSASTTPSVSAASLSRVESDVEAESDLDLLMSPSEDDLDDFDDDEITSSPRKLTARQRDMNKQEAVEINIPATLPSKRNSKRELTEEEQLLEGEKQRKRRHLRDQKLEDSKKAIVERLLQKQSTRSKKSQKTLQSIDNQQQQTGEEVKKDEVVPLGTTSEKYISRRDGEYYISDSVVTFSTTTPNTTIMCCVRGCDNVKKCSFNGKPFCGSLQCYRKLCK